VERVNLEARVLQLLEDVGMKAGQMVLDFGCGSGTYTIPAAKIIGDKGKVYALDKDSEALNELMRKAQSEGLNNIERLETEGELRIDLTDNSVDVVLLFDVLHSYYFPQVDDKRKLFNEVHRICKAETLVLVYPKHMESTAKDEIENAAFHLKSVYLGILVHDDKDAQKGQVLVFKPG